MALHKESLYYVDSIYSQENLVSSPTSNYWKPTSNLISGIGTMLVIFFNAKEENHKFYVINFILIVSHLKLSAGQFISKPFYIEIDQSH